MARTAADTPRTPPPIPARRTPPGRRRRPLLVVMAVIAAVAVLGAGVVLVRLALPVSASTECRVVSGTDTFTLDLDQAANATTIAAVGKQRGLPDHAVSVALAAALQESHLRNLTYGDRDSLGLFQQRPSQGWGTPDQLTTPSYAAGAFYRELTRVDGWESLPITVAAQRVQRSAAPNAYSKWEPEARGLAAALTGEQPGAFTCRFSTADDAQPGDYHAALQRDLGTIDLGSDLAPATGWTAASWLVGHARDLGITSVAVQDRRWTAASGHWKPDAAAGAAVQVEQVRGS